MSSIIESILGCSLGKCIDVWVSGYVNQEGFIQPSPARLYISRSMMFTEKFKIYNSFNRSEDGLSLSLYGLNLNFTINEYSISVNDLPNNLYNYIISLKKPIVKKFYKLFIEKKLQSLCNTFPNKLVYRRVFELLETFLKLDVVDKISTLSNTKESILIKFNSLGLYFDISSSGDIFCNNNMVELKDNIENLFKK